jgi:hypothetical protein
MSKIPSAALPRWSKNAALSMEKSYGDISPLSISSVATPASPVSQFWLCDDMICSGAYHGRSSLNHSIHFL